MAPCRCDLSDHGDRPAFKTHVVWSGKSHALFRACMVWVHRSSLVATSAESKTCGSHSEGTCARTKHATCKPSEPTRPESPIARRSLSRTCRKRQTGAGPRASAVPTGATPRSPGATRIKRDAARKRNQDAKEWPNSELSWPSPSHCDVGSHARNR